MWHDRKFSFNWICLWIWFQCKTHIHVFTSYSCSLFSVRMTWNDTNKILDYHFKRDWDLLFFHVIFLWNLMKVHDGTKNKFHTISIHWHISSTLCVINIRKNPILNSMTEFQSTNELWTSANCKLQITNLISNLFFFYYDTVNQFLKIITSILAFRWKRKEKYSAIRKNDKFYAMKIHQEIQTKDKCTQLKTGNSQKPH